MLMHSSLPPRLMNVQLAPTCNSTALCPMIMFVSLPLSLCLCLFYLCFSGKLKKRSQNSVEETSLPDERYMYNVSNVFKPFNL